MFKYFVVNGQIVPKEEATIGIHDLALLRGYGLFDFFQVKQGHPLFFDDYLNRMERSAKSLKLKIPYSRSALKKMVYDLIEKNQVKEAGVKLIMTGGYSKNGYDPTTPNLFMLPVQASVNPDHHFELGVKLMPYEYHRTLPQIKSINYIVGVSLLPEMKAAQAEDILFHFNGFIHETVRANFFLVLPDDTIVTPEEDILKGITRQHVLASAATHYMVERRSIAYAELKQAKEAFITSSTKQLMPVVQVGDITIGEGRPGAVSQHLLTLLRKEEADYFASLNL